MRYCIVGSSRAPLNAQWASRLCSAIKANFVDIMVDKEDDRHSLNWITIEASKDLTEEKVKEIFGPNFELRRKKDGH